MAHVAVLAGRHMVRRRGFTRCGCAVVAGGTVTRDAGVVVPGTRKCRTGHMADIAILAKYIDMRRVDLRCRTGCMNAIVTGIASRCHHRRNAVIKHRRRKAAAGHVADIAVIVRRNMSRRHASRFSRQTCVTA